MAEAGKSLVEIAPFLRETIKNMGNVLEIIACSDHTCNHNPAFYIKILLRHNIGIMDFKRNIDREAGF